MQQRTLEPPAAASAGVRAALVEDLQQLRRPQRERLAHGRPVGEHMQAPDHERPIALQRRLEVGGAGSLEPFRQGGEVLEREQRRAQVEEPRGLESVVAGLDHAAASGAYDSSITRSQSGATSVVAASSASPTPAAPRSRAPSALG